MRDFSGIFKIRSSLLLLLALLGFAFVLISSMRFGIEWIPTSLQFGLLQMLPITYWLGVGLIASSIVLGVRNGNDGLFLCQALLLFVSVWGAPALFERFPSAWDTYLHFQSAQGIIQLGHLDPSLAYTYQNNYPGMFVVTASYFSLGNPDVLTFLRFYPLISASITLVAIYVFLRTYFPGQSSRFALLVAVMANVWIQLAFSPQSLGLATGLLVFAFMEREGLRWHLIALTAFIFLVISHPTTTLFVAGGLVGREILVRLGYWSKRTAAIAKERPWPVFLFIAVWVLWLLTAARTYLNTLADDVMNRLSYVTYLADTVPATFTSRTSANIWTIAPQIRLLAVGLFALLALITLFLYLWTRKKRIFIMPANVLALFLIPFFFIPADIMLLNAQLYDRGILWIMIASPVIFTFGLAFLRKRPKLRLGTMVLVIGVSALCMSTIFYQEALYVVSGQSVNASEFLAQSVDNDTTVIGGRVPVPVWNPALHQDYTGLAYYAFYQVPISNLTRNLGKVVVVFDRSSALWQTQYGDNAAYYFEQIGNNSKVFDNGGYQVVWGRA
jgi:hypothetical protein